MSKRINRISFPPAITVALITTIGVIVGAYLNYRGSIRPLEIAASQTADAIKNAPFMTSTPDVTPTPTTRDWISIFERDFPADYWKEGIHRYLFDADCPFDINSTKSNERPYWFTVKEETNLQGSTVYLRRTGLYLVEYSGTAIGDEINPAQKTTIVYGPLAFTFEDAERLRDECKVRISIDEGEFLDLLPIRIDKIKH